MRGRVGDAGTASHNMLFVARSLMCSDASPQAYAPPCRRGPWFTGLYANVRNDTLITFDNMGYRLWARVYRTTCSHWWTASVSRGPTLSSSKNIHGPIASVMVDATRWRLPCSIPATRSDRRDVPQASRVFAATCCCFVSKRRSYVWCCRLAHPFRSPARQVSLFLIGHCFRMVIRRSRRVLGRGKGASLCGENLRSRYTSSFTVRSQGCESRRRNCSARSESSILMATPCALLCLRPAI